MQSDNISSQTNASQQLPTVQSPTPAQPQSSINKKHSIKPLLFTLLAIILIVGAAFGAYYWQHKKVNDSNAKIANLQSQLSSLQSQVNKPATSTTNPKTTASTSAPNPYAGWKSYCSTVGDICYKYPANWTFSSSFNQGPSPESDSITSPSGDVKVGYASEQIGHYQPNGTVSVIAADSFSSAFQQVALIVQNNATDSTPVNYNTDVFLTNNSSTEYSNINTPFKTGNSYTIGADNDGAMEDRFSVGNISGSSFTVNGNFQSDGENGTSEDVFASLAEAQNWYNSADVQTAVLILRSVTADNQ